MNVLIVSSSPRRNGNSRLLAEAALEGAREAGHSAELVHLDDHLQHFLRDCRECRDANGRCTIDDGYEPMLRERVLPADGVVFATPIYWYGVSGQLKTYFDRMFCFIAASEPESEMFVNGVVGKRLALLMSGEETYPGAMLGAGPRDPGIRPLHALGLRGLRVRDRQQAWRRVPGPGGPDRRGARPRPHAVRARGTDYRIDTERPGSTWATLGVEG